MISLVLQLSTVSVDDFLSMFHFKKKKKKKKKQLRHQQEHLLCVEKEHRQT